jgi:hypothetical protein
VIEQFFCVIFSRAFFADFPPKQINNTCSISKTKIEIQHGQTHWQKTLSYLDKPLGARHQRGDRNPKANLEKGIGQQTAIQPEAVNHPVVADFRNDIVRGCVDAKPGQRRLEAVGADENGDGVGAQPDEGENKAAWEAQSLREYRRRREKLRQERQD